MPKIMLGFLLFASLAGCSHHYQPLDLNRKTRLVTELIDPMPACQAFRNALAAPEMDDDGVDKIFDRTAAAHCLRKDV